MCSPFFGLRCFLLGRKSHCVWKGSVTTLQRFGMGQSTLIFGMSIFYPLVNKRLHSFFYWTWPSRNSGFSSSWCKRLPGRVILFTKFSQSLNPDWTEIHPMISRLSYVPGSLVNSLAMTQVPKLEVPTKAYVSEYHHKIWPYMVQYLHFRILEFPLTNFTVGVPMAPRSVHTRFCCSTGLSWRDLGTSGDSF